MGKLNFEPTIYDNRNIYFEEGYLENSGSTNIHEHIEVFYAISGSGYVFCNSKLIPIEEGDFIIINAYHSHIFNATSNRLSFYNFYLSNNFCNQNGIDIENYYLCEKFRDEILKEKLFRVRDAFSDKGSPFFVPQTYCASLDFILYLIKTNAQKKTDNYTRNHSNIHMAICYIKDNIDKKLDIDKISAQSGLSRYHFSREFKKITGYTVIDYVNLLRCEQICQYICSHNCSVKEAFNNSYFESFPYFSKVFKKYIGLSPSEYMKTKKP